MHEVRKHTLSGNNSVAFMQVPLSAAQPSLNGPRACNEHKNSRMVHALHEQPRAWRPRAPMIQRASREQDGQRRHIDAARCLGLGQKHQN